MLAIFGHLFGGWLPVLSKRRSAPLPVVTRAPKITASAEPLSPREQWQRLTGVVSKAVEHAATARDLHARSAQQLDLATYALYSLADELAGVMSEPLGRGRAVVHRLEPLPVRASAATALAA